MPEQYEQTKARASRKLKLLLGVSLALNLAFVGFLAGAFIRLDGNAGKTFRSFGLGSFGTPYIVALPHEDRRTILRAIRSPEKERLPNRSVRREMFHSVLESIRATPFDLSALQAASSAQATVSVTVQKRAQDAWIAHIADMTDAERLAYADRVKDVLARGGRRH